MAQRGQFSRVHEVSIDGVTWVRAATRPDLFASAAPPASLYGRMPSGIRAHAAGQHSIAKTGVTGHAVRPHFERDLADLRVFMKEVLLVCWRFNPAGRAAAACIQLDSDLSESTLDNSQRGQMVAEVLTTIDIPSVETFEQQCASATGEICALFIERTISLAIQQYPQVKMFLEAHAGGEGCALRERGASSTLTAIQDLRPLYAQLHNHYQQLIGFLPRYLSIAERTGLLDVVVGFTAAFFGGDVGRIAADVWCDWRDSNDQEFLGKFGGAFVQFGQSCDEYTSRGEEVLSVIFDRVMDSVEQSYRTLFDSYYQLADTGWNISPLHQVFRQSLEPTDENTRLCFTLAISSLKDKCTLDYRTIENIQAMTKLSVG